MHIGLGLPDLILCPECEKAVEQENGRFCEVCLHKVHEYQEKHNLVIDFWLNGAPGAPGEPGNEWIREENKKIKYEETKISI